MLPLQLIVFCIFATLTIKIVAVAGNGNRKEASIRLRATLESRYEKDRLIPPMSSGGPLAVDASFKLGRVSQVQDSQATVTGKLWMTWTDVFLQWDPKQFSNISQTMLEDALIWTPPITIANGLIASSRSYGVHIRNNGLCFLWIDVQFVLHRADSGEDWTIELEIAGPTRPQIDLQFPRAASPAYGQLANPWPARSSGGQAVIDSDQFDSVSSHWQILKLRQFTQSSKPMTLTYAFILVPKPCRPRFKLIKPLTAAATVSTAFVMTLLVGFPVGTPFRLPTVIFALLIAVVLDRDNVSIELACNKAIELFNVCTIAFWSFVVFETAVVHAILRQFISTTRKSKLLAGSNSCSQNLEGGMVRSIASDSGIWHSASAPNSETGSSQLSTSQLRPSKKKAMSIPEKIDILITVDRFLLVIGLVTTLFCFWVTV